MPTKSICRGNEAPTKSAANRQRLLTSAAAAFLLSAFCFPNDGCRAAEAAPLFNADFTTNAVGKLGPEFMLIDGAFAVKAEGGNQFLELPGAPLDSFGVLFGPQEASNVCVTARIFGASTGRRHPMFAVGLNGIGGYKLWVAPGREHLELHRGDTLLATAPLKWKSGVWTHLKLQIRPVGQGAYKIEGKLWSGGDAEPAGWDIAIDAKELPPPGRASVWGSPFSGTPIRYDDLQVSRPAAPGAAAPAPKVSARQLTFLVTSDAHYDAFENEDRNERNSRTLREMNHITHRTWPAELGGGPIARPRGVLVLGDVIDDGDRQLDGKHQSPEQYDWFLGDFGLDGTDGLLNWPVFETWGNHDGPPPGKEKLGFSFQANLRQRNLQRQQRGWLANLSANGLHYSLDWEGVHLVLLGIYPANEQNPLLKRYSPEWHHPQGALDFLKEDLAKCVGQSGRPVILASHCGFDTDWWHTNDWKAVYEVARPYNVILYFYGHTGTGLKQWKPAGADQPWRCVNTGQTEKGFFVVEITSHQIRLAYRMKTATIERTPDKKIVWHWDGGWEWRHLLRQELM